MPRAAFITAILLASFVFWPSFAGAQSDEIPLGDLARTLKKNQLPPRTIIDNDNLSAVMEQGESKRWATSRGHPAMQVVNLSTPDVTCALSFSGQKDLLDDSSQPQNLPEDEITKLDGPATIVGNSLQLSIHNGTSWDVREITVGFTVADRQNDLFTQFDGLRLVPATVNNVLMVEKRSDTTALYHLKGIAAPASTTVFEAPLSVKVGPDQEWHWAIVQAKGIPPATTPELPASELMIRSPN